MSTTATTARLNLCVDPMWTILSIYWQFSTLSTLYIVCYTVFVLLRHASVITSQLLCSVG